jgi:hypothetical protein
MVGLAFPNTPEARPEFVAVRLEGHLRSDTRAGKAFRATVIAALEVDGRVYIPAGSVIRGIVRRAGPVGIGLVRERAFLELEFHEYELLNGLRLPLQAHLHSIDNAREEVDAQGRIKGILAASSPHGFVQGLWSRPRPGLFHRSMLGLTGANGMALKKLPLGPVAGAGLFAARLAVLRLPEPEIHLPPGTEMKLRVRGIAADAPYVPAETAEENTAGHILAFLATLPYTLRKPSGAQAADIMNLAFLGSRQDLEQAFAKTGWYPAEPLTARAFSRAYRAYTSMRGYPTAPVSLLLYEGRPPDLVFQKSLNTIAKRHHVRIWRSQAGGEELWLGAATHDVGVAFDRQGFAITHRIDPEIDLEREKIGDDLLFSNCAAKAGFVSRPEAKRDPGRARGIVTDGGLEVLSVGACKAITEESGPVPPPRSAAPARRALRRVTLETRHYLLRGNVYYWGFRFGKWLLSDTRQRGGIEE